MFTQTTKDKNLRRARALVARIQQQRRTTMEKSRLQNSKVNNHIKFLFSQSRYTKLGKLSTVVANRRRVRRKTMHELSKDWQEARVILMRLENNGTLEAEQENLLQELLSKYHTGSNGLAPIHRHLTRIRSLKSSVSQAA